DRLRLVALRLAGGNELEVGRVEDVGNGSSVGRGGPVRLARLRIWGWAAGWATGMAALERGSESTTAPRPRPLRLQGTRPARARISRPGFQDSPTESHQTHRYSAPDTLPNLTSPLARSHT